MEEKAKLSPSKKAPGQSQREFGPVHPEPKKTASPEGEAVFSFYFRRDLEDELDAESD